MSKNELKKGMDIYVVAKSDGAVVFIDNVVEVKEDIVVAESLQHFERFYESSIYSTSKSDNKLYNFYLETPELKKKNGKQKLVNQILNLKLADYDVDQLNEVLKILKK